MSVEVCSGWIYFVPIEVEGFKKIFGFAEFLAALALLAVLYTVTDIRYKFRVAVAPGWLFLTTYCLMAFIGIGTLMLEVWVAQKWCVPYTTWLNSTVWQAGMGVLFLGTFLTWTYYAYMRPPVFGYRNARRYPSEILWFAMRGNEDELKVIVNEVARSSEQLVKHWGRQEKWFKRTAHNRFLKRVWELPWLIPATPDLARDVFLVLSDRRICSIIVKSSPVTAFSLFTDMAMAEDKEFPMSAFSRNITMEAVKQKDSFLYNEIEGYKSGLLGYMKPVSQAVYGNYELLAGIQKAGGLDAFNVEYSEHTSWDGQEWGAYLRALLITLKSFLKTGRTNNRMPVIISAFSTLNTAHMGLEKLTGMENPYQTKTYEAFNEICDFATEGIKAINEATLKPYIHRVRKDVYAGNIYDQFADLVCQLMVDSASVKGPFMTAWSLQHNTVWSSIHSFNEGPAFTVVRRKVRRLLCNHIDKMVEFPNYVSIRAVAFCLNVFGLAPLDRKNKQVRDGFVISRKAQEWAKANYLTVVRDFPEMAEVMLIGSISFDKDNSRLVQTNHYGMSKKATYKYLALQPAMPVLAQLAKVTS